MYISIFHMYLYSAKQSSPHGYFNDVAFVHPHLVFYVVFISRIIFFLLITYILIFITRVVCTHTGGRYYTHDICIVFLIKFLIFIFTTYLINFLIYLSIIFLTLHLYLYVDHIIALIVLYVLYFSYVFNCILCIYGRRLV